MIDGLCCLTSNLNKDLKILFQRRSYLSPDPVLTGPSASHHIVMQNQSHRFESASIFLSFLAGRQQYDLVTIFKAGGLLIDLQKTSTKSGIQALLASYQ